MTSNRADIANAAYEQLLDAVNKVNPALTDVLRKKYEEDRQEFVQAAKEFTPSQDPIYWAKRSCSKCYGRGIIGKRHVFMPGQPAKVMGEILNSVSQIDITCKCTQKTYQKWLAEFRTFYNALKAQTTAEKERGEVEHA